MEEKSNWVKLLKRSEPFPFDTPRGLLEGAFLLAEYKDRYYFLLRREDDGFIGPEDLTSSDAYDTLLEALLVWKQACDDVKKKQGLTGWQGNQGFRGNQ